MSQHKKKSKIWLLIIIDIILILIFLGVWSGTFISVSYTHLTSILSDVYPDFDNICWKKFFNNKFFIIFYGVYYYNIQMCIRDSH